MHSKGTSMLSSPDYMLSIADRCADVLVTSGLIGDELATAIKSEETSCGNR